MSAPIRIVGAPGSPYSRKRRAVLRYRCIAHVWLNHGSPESRALPQPRLQLLPRLVLPGADGAPAAHTDSTPPIGLLEQREAERSVIPPDRAAPTRPRTSTCTGTTDATDEEQP